MKNHEIPRTAGPSQVSGSRQQEPNPSRRILVVDGDTDLRLMYAFVLARPGYDVDVAEDGAVGWQALRAHHYHLLITEHEMPILTGIELIKLLRAARMDLPVVMAAGRMPSYELARNPGLQLAATLLKPFATDELLDTVKRALREKNHPLEHDRMLPDRHSRQVIACSQDDPDLETSARPAINFTNPEPAWVQEDSSRAHPPGDRTLMPPAERNRRDGGNTPRLTP
jgi:two-component system, chemotaxis family, chemotaxis protein CheY